MSIVGAVLSLAAIVILYVFESDRIAAELSRRAARPATAVSTRMHTELAVLAGVEAEVLAGGTLSRADLRGFVRDLRVSRPAAIGIDWIPLIGARQRRDYEEAQWLDGLPGFEITDAEAPAAGKPAGERNEYFPLYLGLEESVQITGLDLSAGVDLGTSPAIRSALDTARNTTKPAMSAPLLVSSQGKEVTTIMVISPVFKRIAAYEGRRERPQNVIGFVLGLYRVDELLDDLLSGPEKIYFNIELRDVDAPAEHRLLWASKSDAQIPRSPLLSVREAVRADSFRWTTTLDMGGRRWAWTVTAAPRFVAANLGWQPWIALLSGLLLTALLVGGDRILNRQAEAVAQLGDDLLAERRTANERVSRLIDELEREKHDRERTEVSLFREKQQFRLMFNAVPAMIWYKDTKNGFLLVNEAAASWMGHTVEEVEGRPCSEIWPDRAYDYYRDDLEIVRTGKPILGTIEEHVSSDGETRWISTDKLPEYDSMGRVVGIIVFALDVSHTRHAEEEIRRLNEELEQRVVERTAELAAANQELESFAYSVSHDLRAPLRGIDGFSRLLMDECGSSLSDPGKEYLGRVRSATHRMGCLIDDLLKLTRVSRSELSRETVDLTALARVVVSELEQTEPDRDVTTQISDTPLAKGDPILLLNVLQNLLGNAWKFTGKESAGRLEFGATRVEDSKTAYFVRDNGVGFDMIYASKLFGAFQRLHGPADFEGSGIGLATVQLIIRRHGGQVWAEGEPNKGATFYFTL